MLREGIEPPWSQGPVDLQSTAFPLGHLSKGEYSIVKQLKGAKPIPNAHLRKRPAPKVSSAIFSWRFREREDRSRWINAGYGDNRRISVLPI